MSTIKLKRIKIKKRNKNIQRKTADLAKVVNACQALWEADDWRLVAVEHRFAFIPHH